MKPNQGTGKGAASSAQANIIAKAGKSALATNRGKMLSDTCDALVQIMGFFLLG